VLIATGRPKGFSLVEVMIAVSILGILVMLALPNYNIWIANARVRTATTSILNGLQIARTEAVRRNLPVFFQLTSASDLSDWTVGCVTVLTAPPIGCPAVIQSYASVEGTQNATVSITDTAGIVDTTTIVTFNSFGRPVSPDPTGPLPIAQVDVTSAVLTAPDARPLRVTVSSGGQVRMCDPALPAPPTNPSGC
jgi:type IV fimbrial biogenesis protein FimT